MKSLQKTNDHRLIGHLAKHFHLDPADYGDLQDLLTMLDSMCVASPLKFQDLVVVYETFPVYGEFMFPKGRSRLWQLIESTDAPMLLTDALVSGKEGLFICQSSTPDSVHSDADYVLTRQKKPALCVNNVQGNRIALLYPVASL